MGARGVLLIVALLAGLLAPGQGAAAADWSGAKNLTSSASTTQVDPQLVMSNNGQRLAAAWIRRTGASTGVLEVSRSTDGGLTWGPVEPVGAAVGDIVTPRLVGSGDLSRLQVFWVVRGQSSHSILTSTSVNGAPWPSATTVTSSLTTLNDISYAVAATPDAAKASVVWLQDVPGNYRVVKYRFTQNGINPSPIEDVSPTPAKASRPTIVSVNNGNWIGVAWVDEYDNPRAARYRTRSSGSWSPIRLLSDGTATTFDPQIAASSAGGVQTVIWRQFLNGDRAVYVATSGAQWTTEVLSTADATSAQVFLAADGSRQVAAWAPVKDTAPTVRVRVGGTWGPPVVLPGPPGDQLQVVATGDAMRLVAVWRSTGAQGLAAAVSANGGTTWSAVDAPADTTIQFPMVALSDNGEVFDAVWSRKVGSSWYPRTASGPPIVPAAEVTPDAVDFGQVSVGGDASRTVTVRNTGLAPLWVTAITVSPGIFSRGAGCGLFVQPGSTCSVTVFMNPTTPGPVSGELTIADNTAGSPRKVALTGVGVEPVVPPVPVTPTATPAPSPIVDAKRVQAPRDRKGTPPSRIRKKGLTVLVGRNAMTNAGERISTKITVKAKRKHYRIIKGKKGKRTIRTFGTKLKRVKLIQKAPETPEYLPYSAKTIYRKNRR